MREPSGRLNGWTGGTTSEGWSERSLSAREIFPRDCEQAAFLGVASAPRPHRSLLLPIEASSREQLHPPSPE
uniref:Uncharacterized protein n=1 Tax=Leersia perrieri TaxID=77586 RepID=A0A0D9XPL0_9ORYZ